MTEHQAIIELVQKAETNEVLRQALQETKTPEDVVQVAADAGVTLTVEEVHAFRQHVQVLQQRAADGELSEAELEQAAGGLALGTTVVLGMLGVGALTGIGGLAAGGVAGVVGGGIGGGIIGGIFGGMMGRS